MAKDHFLILELKDQHRNRENQKKSNQKLVLFKSVFF